MLIDMETDIITEGTRFSKHELQRYETRILYMDMYEHERKYPVSYIPDKG